ncbi:hypothetical protein SD78_2982 [Bacillus badius]|nr:hypothetical protein SD78_2982 [Bacillus badius]
MFLSQFSEGYLFWHLKSAVYGRIFFEYKKAENMQEMNKNLHIFSF